MPAGRPTAYKEEYADLAYKYALLGAIDTQLADFFGVSEQTLNTWKKKHPEFLESLKAGKAKADAEVAEKLFHRAKGYTHEEEKVFCTNGVITSHDTLKHYPPDTTAAIFWLKNRAGWKDKSEVDNTNKNESVHTINYVIKND
jgi:hypothetical protein